MPFRSWKQTEEVLAKDTAPVTNEQKKLGCHLAIAIPDQTPKIVAAAILRRALRDPLHLPRPRGLSERYDGLLRFLRRPSDPKIEPKNDDEAEAWVTYLGLLRRREALSGLKPQEGDIVETKTGELAEMSSIGDDGRLYFKGGRGFSAWPDQVGIVARLKDNSDSARKARRLANNAAARRNTSSSWSLAKTRDLSEFMTTARVTESDIDVLETMIDLANDKRPLQEFLAKNPQLLTALVGGRERFCLDQKRLGAEYVPDFIVGDVDSLGIRWVLMELETPNSGVYTKSGSKLDKNARQGIDQIMDWRNWLTDNLAYARRSRAENGLGLFDIANDSYAIVLIGRRAKMPKTKDSQRREFRRSNIHIHTYDWLLEYLRGAIWHQGPTGTNPYLVPRQSAPGTDLELWLDE